MFPLSFEDLINAALEEYKNSASLVGIPRAAFFTDDFPSGPLPLGPAAGPHTQMAPNFLAAYLSGARFFELKTVQILDELELEKPCIDARDECYNVEWSSEFTLDQAFDEYLKAWFLLHFFKEFLGWTDGGGDFIFNMSVGYDLEGISSPRVDQFIERMKDARIDPRYEAYGAILKKIARREGIDLEIPSPHMGSQISISTMHGCPPDEIEKICSYMLEMKKLNTYVKLNPTLLGEDFINNFLNESGFDYVQVPREAFEKDLVFDDAVSMITRLKDLAQKEKRFFGIKLTNTLGVLNKLDQLPGEEMYLSGRPLYPLSINVAAGLAQAFEGDLAISFSGGLSDYNIADVWETGIRPLTVCTELLKPGGYMRMSQMVESCLEHPASPPERIDVAKLTLLAEESLKSVYKEKKWRGKEKVQISRPLPLFNCVVPPCQEACPIEQDAPRYIKLMGEGNYAGALRVIYEKNPLPGITGHYCSRRCEKNCTRRDYEAPVKIRELKKQAREQGFDDFMAAHKAPELRAGKRAALLGQGLFTLSAAYFLAQRGYETALYLRPDEEEYSLPGYKFPGEIVKGDVDFIKTCGVKIIPCPEGLPSEESLKEEGIALIIDGNNHPKIGLIEDIAAAAKQIDALAGEIPPAPPAPFAGEDREEVERKKGRVNFEIDPKAKLTAEGTQKEALRCLDCHYECNKCIDVCPNRANRAIEVAGEKNRTQILHLDALCNECGNCGTFCPWEGNPYLDKITLFSSAEEFANSQNRGFYLEGETLKLRFSGEGGEIKETAITLGNRGDFMDKNDAPKEYEKMVKTLFEKYAYLLGGKK